MTDATADQPRLQPPLAVSRPALIAGVVGAALALSALAPWPGDYYNFVRLALAACSALLALFAAIAEESKAQIVGFFVAAGIGLFWIFTTGRFGREINMIADVVTAVVFLVLAFTIRPQRKLGIRGVIVVFGLAAVGTTWLFLAQGAAAEAYQDCLDSVPSGEDSSFCSEGPSDF